ncbi:hypothetical protein RB11208 [Rhodopirellula baltica SH 1]|uniref:Uncharacterized protein n=1 Tax=Rhodopirellula baltica (strain DSM 10527 / NCIMB 13988 / SH1) TaxID=243090 RepID=Q7UEP8_RHOBA|nr:hypothetical protein RB11208 [Rhodopirellula baltica SH 1]
MISLADVAKGSHTGNSRDDVRHHLRQSDFSSVSNFEVSIPDHVALVDRNQNRANNRAADHSAYNDRSLGCQTDPITHVRLQVGRSKRGRSFGVCLSADGPRRSVVGIVGIVKRPPHPPAGVDPQCPGERTAVVNPFKMSLSGDLNFRGTVVPLRFGSTAHRFGF